MTVAGVLDDQQKRDFFAGIDIFALPSRSDSFGLVLLEAWANGVPNVAYRAGGIADVIRDGEDGLLVDCGIGNQPEPGVIAKLSEAMRTLVHCADVRQRLGDAGRSRVIKEYNWEDKLAIVRHEYEQISSR